MVGHMKSQIERKFRVHDATIVAHATEPPLHVRQAYLATGKTTVRVRVIGTRAWLTLRGHHHGYDYPIPPQDAQDMMDNVALTAIIDKERYHIDDGAAWTVDVFTGANAPLVLAKTVVKSQTVAIAAPAWLGDEVSGDLRFQNVYLALHPYSAWRHDSSASASA